MKVLHLMQREKFTKTIAEFYDVHFNNGEHEICYINVDGKDSLIDKNFSIKQQEFYLRPHHYFQTIKILKFLKKYDYVVMHSLFFSPIFFLLYPKLIKKIVWVAWGYDLYNYPTTKKGMKAKLKNAIGKNIRNKCGVFVGIFPPDCETFCGKFPRSKAEVFYAPYCGAKIPQELFHYDNTCSLEKKESNEVIYVQIGHSAVKSVNHINILDKIKHLANENIKIILPLSYGDMVYGDEVQAYAEKLFPSKTICLREFLPKEEYFELIRKVDIAIFDTTRQIALGNINRMIFRNVKLYLDGDGVMYNYFLSKGVPIQNTVNLKDITFEEFKSPPVIEDKERFMKYIESSTDLTWKVEAWRNIYNTLKIKKKSKKNK